MKHLRIEKNGTYKYRRRVPKLLQSKLGKSEFVKVIGKSEAEALSNYTQYHDHVERLLHSAKSSTSASPISIKESITAQFEEWSIDPHSPGKSAMERLAREEEADRILQKYPLDPETGHPDTFDISPKDQAMHTALLEGLSKVSVEPTITEAFDFYATEKNEPDPYKRRKQLQRLERVKREVLKVTKADLELSKVSRAHARKLRDNLLERMASSSVMRNIGVMKAVFNLATVEFDLHLNNPFSGLTYPKSADAAIELRYPLPPHIIRQMYVELSNNQTLLDIWTLLHHTGAQNAEILGLVASDLCLDEPVPHLSIRPHGLRTVKQRSRVRKVPVVGLALEVARRLKSHLDQGAPLFPQYCETSLHENYSQTTMRRLRKHTEDKKHVVYGLRHTMKDHLRAARVPERVELAVLGHSGERRVSEQYGSAVSLEELHEVMMRIEFEVP